MYRVSIQPLYEKSIYKPYDSELVIDREYGNISIYNESEDKFESATKNIERKIVENIVKYNIYNDNLTILDDNNNEIDISESELSKYEITYRKILGLYQNLLDINSNDYLRKYFEILNNNSSYQIDMITTHIYNLYFNKMKEYLNSNDKINEFPELYINKLFKAIVYLESVKDLLTKEPTKEEITEITQKAKTFENDDSMNISVSNNIYDSNDNLKTDEIFPIYYRNTSGFHSYEKDRGELTHLNYTTKRLLGITTVEAEKGTLLFKYGEINNYLTTVKNIINNKEDLKNYTNFISQMRNKYSKTKVEELLNDVLTNETITTPSNINNVTITIGNSYCNYS